GAGAGLGGAGGGARVWALGSRAGPPAGGGCGGGRPPLDASAPSLGSTFSRSPFAELKLVFELALKELLSRLWPLLSNSPSTSWPSRVVIVFLAMMVFLTRTGPLTTCTPPPKTALLKAMVELRMSPPCGAKPPPPLWAWLVLMVLLVRFTVNALTPPPWVPAVLLSTVLRISVAPPIASIPPPSVPAVLPLTVLSVRVADPT